MALHKIRTTNRPLEEIEVEDEELVDLEWLGLVLHTKATSDDGLQKAAGAQVAERTDNASPADNTEGASL